VCARACVCVHLRVLRFNHIHKSRYYICPPNIEFTGLALGRTHSRNKIYMQYFSYTANFPSLFITTILEQIDSHCFCLIIRSVMQIYDSYFF
jgi:hypothetical protein